MRNKTFRFIIGSTILFSLFSCNENKEEKNETPDVEEKTYTVTWVNFDDTLLEKDENVKEGEMPHFDGVTPSRESDENYFYTFKEWSPSLAPVTSDVTYKAVYDKEEKVPEVKYYKVTWVNYDNKVLEVDENVKEGEMPTYNGQTPIRDSDDSFFYEFKEWSPKITNVSEDITYKATYNNINAYKIRFVNYDDSLLYETKVKENDEATYVGETPVKPEDDEFKYEFSGWDKELKSIKESFTTKAQYKPIAKENWGPIHWF